MDVAVVAAAVRFIGLDVVPALGFVSDQVLSVWEGIPDPNLMKHRNKYRHIKLIKVPSKFYFHVSLLPIPPPPPNYP